MPLGNFALIAIAVEEQHAKNLRKSIGFLISHMMFIMFYFLKDLRVLHYVTDFAKNNT